MKPNPSEPPAVALSDLSASSRRWVEHVLRTYELEPHGQRLIMLAAHALDRGEEARAAVRRDGAYRENRHGEVKQHPGVNVARDASTTFARLVREAGLDAADAAAPGVRPVAGGRLHGARGA